ncbi:hypothetical protein Hanom_Chr01g00046551 [Helianthus anomalus]
MMVMVLHRELPLSGGETSGPKVGIHEGREKEFYNDSIMILMMSVKFVLEEKKRDVCCEVMMLLGICCFSTFPHLTLTFLI